jgi:hypothetical protein
MANQRTATGQTPDISAFIDGVPAAARRMGRKPRSALQRSRCAKPTAHSRGQCGARSRKGVSVLR